MGASFGIVNTTKLHQFNTKDLKKIYISCVQEMFQIFRGFFSQWNKKAGLIGFVYNFSVDEKAFEISNTKIHMYSMK